jgi:hypothetical protein
MQISQICSGATAGQQEGGRHGCRDEQAYETESWPGPELVGAMDDGGHAAPGVITLAPGIEWM